MHTELRYERATTTGRADMRALMLDSLNREERSLGMTRMA